MCFSWLRVLFIGSFAGVAILDWTLDSVNFAPSRGPVLLGPLRSLPVSGCSGGAPAPSISWGSAGKGPAERLPLRSLQCLET